VGLQAEDTKPVVEGAGLCPGGSLLTRLGLVLIVM